jgi:GNAT superfamily N-acetyltransferase
VIIRFAGPGDAALVHALIVALAAYEREPGAVEATPESLRAQLAAPRPPFEALLAEEGEGAVAVAGAKPAKPAEAVGLALFFHNYSTWRGRPGLYIEDLFVPPEWRGRGVGRALLARLARIAIERGCARMEWAVLDWNRLAIDFYVGLGARPLGEWRLMRLDGEALTRLGGG